MVNFRSFWVWIGKHMDQFCGKMCMGVPMELKRGRPWSDLPPELGSSIAERLSPIELLSFRSVCKDWNSASSAASAKIESRPDYEPWFLLYGKDHEDSGEGNLVTESGKQFTLRLPELDGTTCLASNQGWLLLFKQAQGDQGLEGECGTCCGSSMFFFRPFSRTKIDLPHSPVSELSDHIAAFSCPPTSQDCTVCVMNRVNADKLKLNVLHRGAKEWIQRDVRCSQIDTLKFAAYKTHKQVFYLCDHESGLLIVDTNENPASWRFVKCVPVDRTEHRPGSYISHKSYIENTGMKKKLGLAADTDVSLSTCGTQSQFNGTDNYFYNESITGNGLEKSKSRPSIQRGMDLPKILPSPSKRSDLVNLIMISASCMATSWPIVLV